MESTIPTPEEKEAARREHEDSVRGHEITFSVYNERRAIAEASFDDLHTLLPSEPEWAKHRGNGSRKR